MIGAAEWGRAWPGKTLSCQCDNAVVVVIVNSGKIKVEVAIVLPVLQMGGATKM